MWQGVQRCEKIRSHGFTPIHTGQNKELIGLDPWPPLISSYHLPPVIGHAQDGRATSNDTTTGLKQTTRHGLLAQFCAISLLDSCQLGLNSCISPVNGM